MRETLKKSAKKADAHMLYRASAFGLSFSCQYWEAFLIQNIVGFVHSIAVLRRLLPYAELRESRVKQFFPLFAGELQRQGDSLYRPQRWLVFGVSVLLPAVRDSIPVRLSIRLSALLIRLYNPGFALAHK